MKKNHSLSAAQISDVQNSGRNKPERFFHNPDGQSIKGKKGEKLRDSNNLWKELGKEDNITPNMNSFTDL